MSFGDWVVALSPCFDPMHKGPQHELSSGIKLQEQDELLSFYDWVEQAQQLGLIDFDESSGTWHPLHGIRHGARPPCGRGPGRTVVFLRQGDPDWILLLASRRAAIFASICV